MLASMRANSLDLHCTTMFNFRTESISLEKNSLNYTESIFGKKTILLFDGKKNTLQMMGKIVRTTIYYNTMHYNIASLQTVLHFQYY